MRDTTVDFEAERARLTGLAHKILGDFSEAEDVVQQAWLRLDRTETAIDNLPAWLSTVTTRLCLDRLRKRSGLPTESIEDVGDGEFVDAAGDPAENVALADTVGVALQVVLDQLSPNERVAFILHDTFAFEFPTIAVILKVTPAAARKLASRARAKLAMPRSEDPVADWQVVDAFMAAAREGNFAQLLRLLAPDAVVTGDQHAIASGTPERIQGHQEIAGFFSGSAHAALSAYIDDRAGAAWYHRGAAMVAFDFTVANGRVARIDFRSDPEVLATVVRRDGPSGAAKRDLVAR